MYRYVLTKKTDKIKIKVMNEFRRKVTASNIYFNNPDC